MKKHFLLYTLTSLFLSVTFLSAQNVSINAVGVAPDASALLDINVTGMSPKGLLIPRVSLTSTNDATTIGTPANSLLVYNLGTSGLSPAGYFYNSGTSGSPIWVQLLSGGSPGTSWLLTGNTGTTAGANFIGTTDAKDLVFKTNNLEKVRILPGGNVGIGTTNPLCKLHLVGTGVGGSFQGLAEGFDGVWASKCSHGSIFQLIGHYDGWDSLAIYITGYNANNPAGGSKYNSRAEKVHIGQPERLTVDLMNGNVGVGILSPLYTLDVNGTTRSMNGIWDASDERFKKDIQPITSALSNVQKLQGVTYHWRQEEFKEFHFGNSLQYGVIAQELEKVFPDLVNTDSKGYKAVEYSKLTPLLIEAIKEQQKQMEEMRKLMETMQKKIDQIEKK